jgi:hypothetical protein
MISETEFDGNTFGQLCYNGISIKENAFPRYFHHKKGSE